MQHQHQHFRGQFQRAALMKTLNCIDSLQSQDLFNLESDTAGFLHQTQSFSPSPQVWRSRVKKTYLLWERKNKIQVGIIIIIM